MPGTAGRGVDEQAAAAAAAAIAAVVTEPRSPWDRRPGETGRAYGAFRAYRELGPLRSLARLDIETLNVSVRSVQRWCSTWDWPARAIAWDDEMHRADDARRLDSIRTMHDQHQRAARAAMGKALAALAALDPADIPASAAARLLDIGTRLERETLTTSVEELQGITRMVAETDPWEAIARELGADQ